MSAEAPLFSCYNIYCLLLVQYFVCCSSQCYFCITGSIQGYVFQLGSFNTILTVYIEEQTRTLI